MAVQESPVGVRGRVGRQNPGVSEEAGGIALRQVPVHLPQPLQPWRVVAEGGERALHRPLVGGWVVVD